MADTSENDDSKDAPMFSCDDIRKSIEMKFFLGSSLETQANSSSSSQVGKVMDMSKFPEWKEPYVEEFEDLLIENLTVTYRNAIKTLVIKHGYSKEIVEQTLLRCGPFLGYLKSVNDIVNGVLPYLSNDKEIDTSIHGSFQNIEGLVEYSILNMTLQLRNKNPSLSVVDAMWFLLVCLPLACLLQRQLHELANSYEREFAPDLPKCGHQIVRKVQKIRKESEILLKDIKDMIKPAVCNSQKVLIEQKTSNQDNQDEILQSAGIPYHEALGYKNVPLNEKGEKMLSLVSKLRALQKEDQKWSDWYKEKVEQAVQMSHLILKEKKALILEKEETEKQYLEENDEKRLNEMENELTSTNREAKVAESKVVWLQAENSALKKKAAYVKEKELQTAQEEEKAKLREEEALKKCESIGPKMALLQEELNALKYEEVALKQVMEKSKADINQTEVRTANEEKEKMKVLKQVEIIRKDRERIEAEAKVKEERLLENAKLGLQKLEDEKTKMKEMIRKLKELKSKSEVQKIANLSQGPKVKDKCRICKYAETSVVLVPCGHEALCVDCNEMHKIQGIECPVCRAPIMMRINVGFARDRVFSLESASGK